MDGKARKRQKAYADSARNRRDLSRYKAALERLGQPGARLVLARPLAGPQHHPCENLLAGGSISAAVAAATRPIDRGGVVGIDPDRTGIKPWLGKLRRERLAVPNRATLALVAVHGSMVANVQDGVEPRAYYEGASSDDTDALAIVALLSQDHFSEKADMVACSALNSFERKGAKYPGS